MEVVTNGSIKEEQVSFSDISTNLQGINEQYVGQIIIFTSGRLEGMVRTIVAYDSVTSTISVAKTEHRKLSIWQLLSSWRLLLRSPKQFYRLWRKGIPVTTGFPLPIIPEVEDRFIITKNKWSIGQCEIKMVGEVPVIPHEKGRILKT